jgi:hypothetical protein
MMSAHFHFEIRTWHGGRFAMNGQLTVSSWVDIQDGCPINFAVGGSGVVFVTCGDGAEGFEFHLSSEALRDFVRLGGEALREMDTIHAGEEAERDSGSRH